MSDVPELSALEIAQEWRFYATRFGIVAEIINGRYTDHQCMALALAVIDGDAAVRRKPYEPDRVRVDRGDFVRVSGNVTCDVCACAYYDHPPVVGFEFLRRACDGRILKL